MTKAQTPEMKAMLARLSEVPIEFIECRDSHQWERVQPLIGVQHGRIIAHQCRRCKMVKQRHISTVSGEYLSSPNYTPPPGYYLRHVAGALRPNAKAIRLMLANNTPPGLPVAELTTGE